METACTQEVYQEQTSNHYQQQKQLSMKHKHQRATLYHRHALEEVQQLSTQSSQHQHAKATPGATSVLLSFLNDIGDNTDFSQDFFFPDIQMV